MSKVLVSRIRSLCGILSVVLLAVIIISGYGWDIRTSDLITRLTGGLLNRNNSMDLHNVLIVPFVVLLAIHIAPSLKKYFVTGKAKANSTSSNR